MSARTVLVVEDDPDITEVLKDVLEGEGLAVVTAANGREGLDRLAEIGNPCLILLDLMMPVMSGSEFLDVLRASPEGASLPVVVVSAWPSEADRVRGKTQGHLKKPVSLDALLEALKQCLDGGPEEARP